MHHPLNAEKILINDNGSCLVIVERRPLGVCVVKLDGWDPDGGGLVVGHPVLELVSLQVLKPGRQEQFLFM